MPQSQVVTILLVSDDADHVQKLEQTLRQTHIATPLIILRARQEGRELGQTQTQTHRRRLIVERVELEECQRRERETPPPGVAPQALRQRHTAEWQALKKRQGMG